MATRKYKFKHIAASSGSYVGDAGELILDTSTNTLKVSDGSTAGGVTLTTDGTGGGGGSTGDLTITGSTISSPSNADITLVPGGTGQVVLNEIKSDDSSAVTIRDSLNVDEYVNATYITASVTVTGGSVQVTGDAALNSTGLLLGSGDSSDSDSDHKITFQPTTENGGSVEIYAVRPTGAQTSDTKFYIPNFGSNSSPVRYFVTTSTDGGGSGQTTGLTGNLDTILGDIGFSGNRLKTSSSNADLELDANGTGSVVVMSPTFTIKDENFAGSPTIRDFTNDAFDMYNTLNINKKPSGAEGIRVDTYNAGYNVKSTTNSGSSTITNFKFNFAELTNGTEAERVGTLRFDSGIDNGGSLSQSVNMDFIPTNSGESGNNYYSFREDGLYLGSNVANIKNFGSPGYIGFDWIRVDGVDVKDNIITTNSSNADLQLDANGTGAVDILTQVVRIANLPTSDPSSAGQLWNDSGTLKISAG